MSYHRSDRHVPVRWKIVVQMSVLSKCVPFFPEVFVYTLVTVVTSSIRQGFHSLRLIDYQMLFNLHFKHGLGNLGGRREEKSHHRVSLPHVRNDATVLKWVEVQKTKNAHNGPRTAEAFVHFFDQIRSFQIFLSCTRLKVGSMPTLLKD